MHSASIHDTTTQCFLIFFSFVSGITLLGTPTEIYVYGVQYMFIVIGILFMGVAMAYIYLPVFHDLQLTSTYHVSQITNEIPSLCGNETHDLYTYNYMTRKGSL